jgi:addiction module RelB/DinJ family antitoxin
MSELASLNLKLPATLKNDFTQTAEALGMPAATALKVLITRFVEVGGFPFDVRIQRQGFNWNDPRIIRTYHQNGKLMMPAQWRDEDDDDDVE